MIEDRLEESGVLSDRELEVLRLAATGATNQQIARSLVISPNTVKVHLRNIYEKLGVQSRTEATIEAVKRGLVVVPGSEAVPAGETAAGTASRLVEAGADGAVSAGALALPSALPPLPTVAPAVPIARWQRMYMLAAALLVITLAWMPEWWLNRAHALQVTPLSDAGQPQMALAPLAKADRWMARAALPEGRSRLALAASGGKLYAIGGETANGITDEVTVFDPQSNGWLARARKPTPVANVSAGVINGRIYVPGGVTPATRVTDALEVYDPTADQWEKRAALPEPIAAYGLAVLSNKLYLFGGWDGARYQAEAYVYDPAADKWQMLTPMPTHRGFLAAGALQSQIYVVGGYDGQRELNTVEVYNPSGEGTKAGPWSKRAPLAQERAGLGLLALNNRLYAIGGGWNSTLAFNEQYDVNAGAWSRIESPVTGQWRNLGLAQQGDYIYAVGGWSGGYLAATEQYTAVLRIMLPVSVGGGAVGGK
jgi:DNA-binding CsgD family transcriptional regulator/N-acetylneuraminic acid mutarotase